jgi:hypothetical protein
MNDRMGTLRHWADGAAELAGAVALGGGLGISCLLVAPLARVAPLLVGATGAIVGFVAGGLIVRMAPSAPPTIAPFELHALEPCPDQATAKEVDDPDEMLLDALVPDRAVGSRVVQLFEPSFTPGALQARIEAHLGGGASAAASHPSPAPWNGAPAGPDASDALHAALAEIRRSLRAR